MIVKVTRCLGSFRLEMPNGMRESISNPDSDWWDRDAAIRAKDVIAPNYGVDRRKIRFVHTN